MNNKEIIDKYDPNNYLSYADWVSEITGIKFLRYQKFFINSIYNCNVCSKADLCNARNGTCWRDKITQLLLKLKS